MVRGQLRDDRNGYQAYINFVLQQHVGDPGRIISFQIDKFRNWWPFESIDQWPCIKVINDAYTNLAQLGYFCGQR